MLSYSSGKYSTRRRLHRRWRGGIAEGEFFSLSLEAVSCDVRRRPINKLFFYAFEQVVYRETFHDVRGNQELKRV